MAKKTGELYEIRRLIKRSAFLATILFLLAIFAFWRIDAYRVERFRANLIDNIVPSLSWVLLPLRKTADIISSFQNYTSLFEQNQSLRRELQRMRAWKEAALQLEQQNAKLLDLNGVQIDPKLTHITARVLSDSGSRFRQSVLINVGRRDGIKDGWAVMDGIGVVGRIVGVGNRSSRVLLLTDSTSRIPVVIRPSGQKGFLIGDNSVYPLLEFIEKPDDIHPGDRIVTTSDGGVFPANLLVGQVVMDNKRHPRTALSADYRRLDFLRVLRSHNLDEITNEDVLLLPPASSDNDNHTEPKPYGDFPLKIPQDTENGISLDNG